ELGEHLLRDGALSRAELELAEERARLRDDERFDLVDPASSDSHSEKLGLETAASTHRAGCAFEKMGDPVALEPAGALGRAFLEHGDEPRPARVIGAEADPDRDALIAEPVEEAPLSVGAKLSSCRPVLDAELAHKRFQHREDRWAILREKTPQPAIERFEKRARRIGDHARDDDSALEARASTARAGALDAIEGEHARRQRRVEPEMPPRTGWLPRVELDRKTLDAKSHDARAVRQSLADRILKPRLHALSNDEPIDDD